MYISIIIHPCIYCIIVWNSLNYVSHSSTILSSAVAGYLKCYTEKRFLRNHINKSYRFNVRIHMYLRIQKIIIDMQYYLMTVLIVSKIYYCSSNFFHVYRYLGIFRCNSLVILILQICTVIYFV